MATRGIGKRYALALFNAAEAERVLEQVHDDLVSFEKLLVSEAGFRRFLASRRATPGDKKDLVARAIGERASGLLVKFILFLIDKHRMDQFEDIAKAFTALYEEHAGIVRVGIVTAIELDAELERKARETIERRTGRKATLVKRVDPGIIGGMIMIASDRIIDGSVRSQLGELRKALLETRAH